jgi:hypothetical protein
MAADAIVLTQPETVDYVRICDAFGKGYFYIPGTESCLNVKGYVRFQVNIKPNARGTSDYDVFTRGQLSFNAKNDTEYGPLASTIVLLSNANGGASSETHLDSAYLDIAGIRAGLFYGWWDEDLSGDTDNIASDETLHNSLRYQYESDGFYAGISIDEMEDYASKPNDIGVAFGIGGEVGAFEYQLTGGYDTDFRDGAIRAKTTLEAGPGVIGLAAVYSSNPNGYYSAAQWAFAAEYAVNATDKLKVIPAFQYYDGYRANAAKTDFGTGDALKIGVTLDYQIVENLYAKISLQHLKPQKGDDVTNGFFRLQRAF